MNERPRRWRPQCLAPIVLASLVYAAGAQDESLSPGINKNYENPNVERIVKQYERDNRDVVEHSKEIVAACRLKPGMDVADIGAGTGLHTRPIARKVLPGGKVYAVEITKPFLEQIEKTCRDQGIDNVVCVHSKVDSTELDPESIDVAFLCDTYHHFEYPYKMLDSIRTALRPGGRLVVVDYKKEEGVSPKWVFGHVRANKNAVVEECEKAGFTFLDEVPDVMKIHYVLRFKKPSALEKPRPETTPCTNPKGQAVSPGPH
jgi:ubiquinone/menaquinone biosynthesis C-methylase UbiE